MISRALAMLSGSLAITGSTLAGGPLTAIAATGQPTPGSSGNPVTNINDPYVTDDGRVGFTGAITVARTAVNFVWVDGQIVWLNSDALPTLLTGAEATMGLSNDLQWIYSPSEAGSDAVWSNGASLLKETDPAPGIPGQFITFCSRPQMTSNGIPTWVSGISAVQGGGAQYRALYAGSNLVLKGGDIVSGESIITAGGSIGFAYDFSSQGTNYIARAIISAPTASNDVIVYNGAILARESLSTGAGDNWQGFGEMKANERGDVAFTGDTDGATTSDGFLAFNDELIVREGQNVQGFVLTGNPLAVGLNDLRQVGAIWNSNLGEVLFVITPGVAGPQTEILAKIGDPVDLNGDSIADGTISDFNASTAAAPGLDLPRQCRVCVNVDVETSPGVSVIAVVCVPLPAAPGLADLTGDGTVDGADLAIILGGWDGPGPTDFNCDGTTDGADLAILLGAWGTGV